MLRPQTAAQKKSHSADLFAFRDGLDLQRAGPGEPEQWEMLSGYCHSGLERAARSGRLLSAAACRPREQLYSQTTHQISFQAAGCRNLRSSTNYSYTIARQQRRKAPGRDNPPPGAGTAPGPEAEPGNVTAGMRDPPLPPWPPRRRRLFLITHFLS